MRLALIAHDDKKSDAIEFARTHRDALLRICDVHDVPLATNWASAGFLAKD